MAIQASLTCAPLDARTSEPAHRFRNGKRGLFLRLSMVFAILALLNVSAVAATNDLVSQWLAAQSNLKTWSADFVQTRSLKSLADPVKAAGHLSFSAPDKFRWEINQPSPTIALRSGPELWVIYPRLKRAERYPLTGTASGPWRDTLALLEAGFPRSQADLEGRFRIQNQTVTNGVCALDLQPRSASARRMIPRITILFGTNDFTLRATELEFADGSTMRNSFSESVMNPPLEPNLFQPDLGSDFKIVEPAAQNRR